MPSAARVALTEAPIDALSLAQLGLPSLALCGTTWPAWLPSFLSDRQVYLAFDADDAGDSAATNLADVLTGLKISNDRLRPERCNDWNEELFSVLPA